MKKKIAITGLGIICAAGRDILSFRSALRADQTAIGPIDLFDVSPFPVRIGAQVREYEPLAYFSRRQAARLSRTDQLGMIAAEEALRASGILGSVSPYDLGVCVGAGAAGMLQAEQWLQRLVEKRMARPSLLRGLLPDRTATTIASTFGLAGYQGTITTACSSSATAIGWGADLVATGRQKAVLCGGADSISLLTFAGFTSLKVMDPLPCAPFSAGRQGISLGEAAAFFVLEEAEEAERRGATIYGYVLGYAVAAEAHHMTAPEPAGEQTARVMAEAVKRGGIVPDRVGWVNAHGTGTPLNDVVEARAVKSLLRVPLISTKGLTGHCLGAAGAVEAVATILALNEGMIPQTLNFRGRDPECDVDCCHDAPRQTTAEVALSNSFAFGGNITTLVLERKPG